MESAPTPYPDLNQVLQELLKRVGAPRSDKFVGLYLQGSFAVGEFDEHSDVDFIVVITRDSYYYAALWQGHFDPSRALQ
jgi:predicted nucleotidyltransferase